MNTLWNCGGKLFSEVLNPHCKLETLRLIGCELKEEQCEVVASAVKYMEFLKDLDLSENHMSKTGLQLLNAVLVHLNVSISRYHHGEDGRVKPELRKYACELTLDPNTANSRLSLSEGNRKVTREGWQQQQYPDHPDRFDSWELVLCREGLTGRCYWEAEWSGGGPDIAVAYKSIKRKGDGGESKFGGNDKSWSLGCSSNSYTAHHNNKSTDIPAPSPHSSRVGVYLDWPAGTLSFYSVSSDTLTHLHTFHSTFTQPLYPGFKVFYGSSVSLCQMTAAPPPTATPESAESSHTP
ncbi:stonustoxin subunit alpha-like isoform X6 [Engraulis encrasicolus]|uniref:stonustoxin subunit alpha-like isoform X6 n=1 Tax=Engraulis encrasicolus TaxID=184585 RepID=UPI002FD2421C